MNDCMNEWDECAMYLGETSPKAFVPCIGFASFMDRVL
jgi:hypothetical protein